LIAGWRAKTRDLRVDGVSGDQKAQIGQAVNRALANELAADESVMVQSEDIGALGGVYRVTENLAARFGSDRVVDAPLGEPGIVGTSIPSRSATHKIKLNAPELVQAREPSLDAPNDIPGFTGPAYSALVAQRINRRCIWVPTLEAAGVRFQCCFYALRSGKPPFELAKDRQTKL